MKKQKKSYAKPILKGVKIMEVGTQTCCRATSSTCTNTNRNNFGKSQRTVTVS